jgi:hypothetical protein
MIPWFIVDIVGWFAERFGYQTYVRAYSDAWGADAIHFIYNPDAKPLPKLKARR